jgi:hypothetical protein
MIYASYVHHRSAALVAAALSLLTGCGSEDRRKEYAQAPAVSASLLADAKAATPNNTASAPKPVPTPGTVRRDTELKEKPFVDAKTLKRLPSGSKVTVADRDGGWLRVSVGNQQGWVRLLHVSTQPAAADGSKELKSATKIATGRAGSGNVVATTGIRGLNEAQLSAAKPNPEELKKLDGYVVTKEQAAEYARQHKHTRRDVPYPPEPR